jgi:hypothetical protein
LGGCFRSDPARSAVMCFVAFASGGINPTLSHLPTAMHVSKSLLHTQTVVSTEGIAYQDAPLSLKSAGSILRARRFVDACAG